MMPLFTVAFVLLATLLLVYRWLKQKYSFWKDRGVMTPPIIYPWGNFREPILQKESFSDTIHKFYHLFKSKGVLHGGVYSFVTPVYIPMNVNIVKAILQNDFEHFAERGINVNAEDDPLCANLFTHNETKWRNLRSKFTPAFSLLKLRMMYGTLLKCTEDLDEALLEYDGKHVDIKEIFQRFTMNVIGSCGFGFECNCLKEPNNEFQINGAAFFHRTTFENFKIYLTDVLPNLMKLLHVTVSRPQTIEFFRQLIQDTMDNRERNNVIRKDFIHLLLQLKNRGRLDDTEEAGEIEKQENDEILSMDDILGQAYVFFIAGYETPSNNICYTLYFMAMYQDIQKRCREEIEDCVERHGGKLSYDALSEMEYVESVINESLRFYPPVHVLNRMCTKDYKVPGTDLVLKRGQKILIPVLGIHKDEEYYKDPYTFDPSRFSAENSRKRNPFTFLPFGLGPRNCIGLRLGMVQVKTSVVAVIRNFEISLNEKTKYPLEFDTGHPLTLSPKDGIWLNIKKIQKTSSNCD